MPFTNARPIGAAHRRNPPHVEDGRRVPLPGDETFASTWYWAKGERPHVEQPLQPFTLIGATTRADDFARPRSLSDSRTARVHTHAELTEIVTRNAGKLNLPMALEAGEEIAARSRSIAPDCEQPSALS